MFFLYSWDQQLYSFDYYLIKKINLYRPILDLQRIINIFITNVLNKTSTYQVLIVRKLNQVNQMTKLIYSCFVKTPNY